MDNLTHSLVGALSAELVLRLAPERLRPKRRGALFLAAIAANNLPDIDFAYAGITEGKLGYLMHHRGHTHTLLGALALAVLSVAAFWPWSRRWCKDQNAAGVRNERLWIGVVSGLGALLHIAMDFGNSYGVHPFWPLDDRWYYGDVIFIIEPYLWVVLSALCFVRCQRTWTRVVAALPSAAALAFVWLLPVPWLAAVLVSVLVLGCIAARRWLASANALLAGLGFVAVLYAVLLAARATVGELARAELSQRERFELRELVRAPMPATPWCWEVIGLGVIGAAEYSVRVGRVALLPDLLPAKACPDSRLDINAPVEILDRGSSSVFWDFEYRLPLSTFEPALANCWFRGFLRFARVPYYDPATGRVGDLRYDRTASDGFSEFILPSGDECPRRLPPWVPPRSDVFAP